MENTNGMKLSILLCAALATSASAQTIYKTPAYQWKGNQIIEGKYRAKALSDNVMTSNYKSEWTSSAPNYMPQMPTGINPELWLLKRFISDLPQFTSTNVMECAQWNMSLEESLLAIEPDSTFRTGVFWGGVWTRDVSYAILHSLAQLHPEVSKISLLAKVNDNNRIIQDTGTGGAWPCSTDRTTWVLAAWEVYKVTGDREWLDRIFPVIKNTLEDDRQVAYDPVTKLMHGETSWLDWREQEYPTWMQPADIFQSECMGTTAVHYQSLRILAEICRLKAMPQLAEKYSQWAADLKEGMNRHLWLEDKGFYAIYRYGRNFSIAHPQYEVLGESFAILWDIANEEQKRRISESMPSTYFGTQDMFPNLKDQFPYHNDAMWPFTQGYWMKAQARVGNEEGVLHSIASIYRLAALNLSNMENMVIYDGNSKGLAINSPRQLWSVAANLAIVPNIYFGINYETEGIRFAPVIPKAMKGTRQLTNFKYRDMVLDLTVTGAGSQLASFKLDGQECEAYLAGNLTGHHTIEMQLTTRTSQTPQTITLCDNAYQPLTPVTRLEGNVLSFDPVPDAVEYRLLHNGEVSQTLQTPQTSQTPQPQSFTLTADGDYSVLALNAEGYQSYMSEPVRYYVEHPAQFYEVEQYALPFNPDRRIVKQSGGTGGGEAGSVEERKAIPTLKGVDISGHMGKGVAMITRNENIIITIPIEVDAHAVYSLDWRYANGNGPINTENKCATRLLSVDGEPLGVSVFPHRGTDEWNNWGWSNEVCLTLKPGKHIVTLEFAEPVENMNLTVNQALLDQLRVTRIR